MRLGREAVQATRDTVSTQSLVHPTNCLRKHYKTRTPTQYNLPMPYQNPGGRTGGPSPLQPPKSSFPFSSLSMPARKRIVADSKPGQGVRWPTHLRELICTVHATWNWGWRRVAAALHLPKYTVQSVIQERVRRGHSEPMLLGEDATRAAGMLLLLLHGACLETIFGLERLRWGAAGLRSADARG